MAVCLYRQLLFVSVFLLLSSILITMSAKRLLHVEFEVFGRVQGVFFRKHTQQQSKALSLKGWCMNTERGTVQGVMEGEEENIREMKRWLQYTGSPSSQIEKAEFRNEKEVKTWSFSDFKVRK